MRYSKNFIHLFLLFVFAFCFGQKSDLWYPFFKKETNTMGFKDKDGKVMIEPKFFASFGSVPFNHIYGVTEILENDKFQEYYLLKSGKKVGIDSVYYFDTEVAYEREEKIRFRDNKTDRVGFFDKNGKVVIPAIYNESEDFYNGLAIVYKDGKRWCYDNNSEERKNCEHYGWINNKSIVINLKNQQLFEIKDNNYNLYDFRNIYKNFKLNENVDSDIYISYKGNDDNTYSFFSPEKDFKKWFETKFLPDFKSNGKISSKYFDKIIELQRENKSRNINNTIFLNKHAQNINNIIKAYLQNEFEISYSDENIFNEENKELTIELRFSPKIFKNFYQKVIVFKKIGNSFFITSSP